MEFPNQFIAFSDEFTTYEKHIPAPYLRKSFSVAEGLKKAEIVITGLGFYELYINGTNITKGLLAPYISSPDDVVYYDRYDIAEHLVTGENVIGIMLGNGMQNAFGGQVWDFDKALWRGAPKTALRMILEYQNETVEIQSDTTFKTAPSPVVFDDLRCGEWYDARLEQKGWNQAGFDDSSWKNAVWAPQPGGERVFCHAEPIVVSNKLKAVNITEQDGGYLYDFGVNAAGICELAVAGTPGQEISILYGEHLIDERLSQENISFYRPDEGKSTVYVQNEKYICKGEGVETYTPKFTYCGFRYAFVSGVTKEQATKGLLTYLVMHSDLQERGNFSCSDDMANTLQEITRRSDLANFYYFPTDCPQREKNGWTADAALSAEHMLLNLSPEKSYREWLKNIRHAQAMDGSLPGIIPTGGWGFEWGNGPAWDCVLVELPYQTYIYRGDKEILKDNAAAILRYLQYINSRRDDRGLLAIGLGDWCPVGRGASDYKSPLLFTDSVIAMDIAQKSAFIFDILHMKLEQEYAEKLSLELRSNIRKHLIDFSTMTASGNCQTSQAMAIYYDIFDEGEKQAAFQRLMEFVHQAGDSMDVGVLGGRVLFHVLSSFGQADLAYHMITKPEYPSYGNWVVRGATSLWEDFTPEGGRVTSHNHHFWGDISTWFIKEIAGIHMNPYGRDVNEAVICPRFISSLNYAEGYHAAPAGTIKTKWARSNDAILLQVTVPDSAYGKIKLPLGFYFEDGLAEKTLKSGGYTIHS